MIRFSERIILPNPTKNIADKTHKTLTANKVRRLNVMTVRNVRVLRNSWCCNEVFRLSLVAHEHVGDFLILVLSSLSLLCPFV